MGKGNQQAASLAHFKASSSARAAERQGGQLRTFSAFSNTAGTPGATAGRGYLVPGEDDKLMPDLKQALSKLKKRDAVTRVKVDASHRLRPAFVHGAPAHAQRALTLLLAFTQTLEEVLAILNGTEDDQILATLEHWPRLYNRLSQDADRRARDFTARVWAVLATRAGKRIAPFLKAILPAWLLAQHDPSREVAKQTRDTFTTLFATSDKQHKTISFAQEEIVAAYRFNLLELSLEDLRNQNTGDDEQELRDKHSRILTNTLLALGDVLRLDHEALAVAYPALQELFADSRLWKLHKLDNPDILASLYALVGTAVRFHPDLLDHDLKRVASLLCKYVPSTLGSHGSRTPQDVWSVLSPQKTLLPRVWQLSAQLGGAIAETFFNGLVPLLACIPSDLVEGVQLFEACTEALLAGLVGKASRATCPGSIYLGAWQALLLHFGPTHQELAQNALVQLVQTLCFNPSADWVRAEQLIQFCSTIASTNELASLGLLRDALDALARRQVAWITEVAASPASAASTPHVDDDVADGNESPPLSPSTVTAPADAAPARVSFAPDATAMLPAGEVPSAEVQSKPEAPEVRLRAQRALAVLSALLEADPELRGHVSGNLVLPGLSVWSEAGDLPVSLAHFILKAAQGCTLTTEQAADVLARVDALTSVVAAASRADLFGLACRSLMAADAHAQEQWSARLVARAGELDQRSVLLEALVCVAPREGANWSTALIEQLAREVHALEDATTSPTAQVQDLATAAGHLWCLSVTATTSDALRPVLLDIRPTCHDLLAVEASENSAARTFALAVHDGLSPTSAFATEQLSEVSWLLTRCVEVLAHRSAQPLCVQADALPSDLPARLNAVLQRVLTVLYHDVGPSSAIVLELLESVLNGPVWQKGSALDHALGAAMTGLPLPVRTAVLGRLATQAELRMSTGGPPSLKDLATGLVTFGDVDLARIEEAVSQRMALAPARRLLDLLVTESGWDAFSADQSVSAEQLAGLTSLWALERSDATEVGARALDDDFISPVLSNSTAPLPAIELLQAALCLKEENGRVAYLQAILSRVEGLLGLDATVLAAQALAKWPATGAVWTAALDMKLTSARGAQAIQLLAAYLPGPTGSAQTAPLLASLTTRVEGVAHEGLSLLDDPSPLLSPILACSVVAANLARSRYQVDMAAAAALADEAQQALSEAARAALQRQQATRIQLPEGSTKVIQALRQCLEVIQSWQDAEEELLEFREDDEDELPRPQRLVKMAVASGMKAAPPALADAAREWQSFFLPNSSEICYAHLERSAAAALAGNTGTVASALHAVIGELGQLCLDDEDKASGWGVSDADDELEEELETTSEGVVVVRATQRERPADIMLKFLEPFILALGGDERRCEAEEHAVDLLWQRGHLLLWNLLTVVFERVSAELRPALANPLLYEGTFCPSLTYYFDHFLENQRALPTDIGEMLERPQAQRLGDLAPSPAGLVRLAALVYGHFFLRMPAMAVSSFTSTIVSPVVCRGELNAADARTVGSDDEDESRVTVQSRFAVREVSAVYRKDTLTLELVIKLPEDYPLSKAEVGRERATGWQMDNRLYPSNPGFWVVYVDLTGAACGHFWGQMAQVGSVTLPLHQQPERQHRGCGAIVEAKRGQDF
ncbi:uncharacterized protein MONBRDRAFT_29273 [Monosiga brevicollis MX1]|uniref:E3 ubiquitin-protein ligase listerin n=1 Tax=Monosiga brevicollis TaxID=81824 RepID=A9VAL9_MONBE|nr:uncharacterized protein MONBRDRAFT_29273 [Monosiga brevicollis MX1]EDQ85345.1 predicted protein [Monosiga brevicollis MX1]|eukprot:XP_001749756.1 hypothetical protein [Monosiga brevicollis MX1]